MKALEEMRKVVRNPQEVAREAKAAGKKVLGYRCLFVPEEMIDAAGVVPYPIFGTAEAVTLADSYFQPNICEFIRNIFDLALKGKLDFLDGLALCNTCDAVRKLYDHWNAYIKTPFCYMINNPQRQFTEAGFHFQMEELEQFRQALAGLTGAPVTDDALGKSIRLHNETRTLLREVYEFRKPDPPMLSGEEALDVVMATMVLPKIKANALLRQLAGELMQRRQPPVNLGPRIMITGSIIDQPGLIRMVEESGGVVVSDDLCTATRYFWYKVSEDGDPMAALARHTTEKPVCACMHPAEARVEYMMDLVREYNVQGIIYFNLMYCDPFLYEGVLFKKKFEDRGIPTIALETEHIPSGMGQLKTRVQAFLEML
ncbi:MAG: 2-hydroxyacyl-CoA dehydratase family protein [Dehalococcoidia bacterium]|nr:2-hydroxyacyl-CoA dehydratase family protein [Dehalococcoidia bacterium]